MLHKKKDHPKEKDKLHPRSKHRERYDFKQLVEICPELCSFVTMNIYNDDTIDFSNPAAVKMLNRALLHHFYDIKNWDIPQNYLCPPIPGRADYIHHIADLLGSCNQGVIPTGKGVKCLDIGMGANCVYPVIGNKEYGWSFVGSDIDPVSVEWAKNIIISNPFLQDQIEIRLQPNPKDIFPGIILEQERFDISICNPTFHASFNDAQMGTRRKLNNLNRKKETKFLLNFGGQNGELWCEGGEERFIQDMILQSKQFATSCFWFSSLVSKESHLKNIYSGLENAAVAKFKTLPMGQGNKTSRIVAWTFFTPEQMLNWTFK